MCELLLRLTSRRFTTCSQVTPEIFEDVLGAWRLRAPPPADLVVDCSQPCATWGWKYARRPCEPPPTLPPGAEVARHAGTVAGEGAALPWRGFSAPWNGTFCRFDPSASGWACCFLRTSKRR